MACSSNDGTLMAANKEEEEEKLHIAMFPWLAFGHMMPYLELAKLLAQKGHKISFISTPRNIDRLPKLPQNLSHLINMVKLPLPYVHGLPKDAEATADVALEKGQTLKRAHDLLRDLLAEFLVCSKPDWLFYDFAAFWLPEISRDLGIRSVFFSIFIASFLGFIPTELPDYRNTPEDLMVPPRWVTFPSTVAMRRFEITRVGDEIARDGDNVISITYRFAEVLKGCDVIAVRGSRELESEWLNLLEERVRKPVFPVGQLFPTPYPSQSQDTWQSMKEWFDEKGTNSVAYVAFGSEAELSQADLIELAFGLELSDMPFFWAIRGRTGEPIELPDGFEERVGKRGIVCCSWAPQLDILAHRSVGVFLSHSGWSSVVEALKFSKPLVLLSFANDQGLNERFLEEKMMGYPVPRDQNDGSFTRESVAESLKLVAYKEEGRVYRDKAKEMSPFFGDRVLQEKYVDEFLGYLKAHKNQEKEGFCT